MILRFILFFGVFIAVLLGAHFAVYFTVIRFFETTEPGMRTFLLWAVLVLALSFFVSAVLIRLHGNAVFNAFYMISAFWIGLLVQLLFVSAALWILFGLSKWIGFSLPFFHIASVLFGLAFVVAMCGVWNAEHPVVRSVEVGLKNLPTQWQGKKIVQLSDVHLGAIHGPRFMAKLARLANAQKPDLIVITGDLFDGMDGNLTHLIEPLDSLGAKQGVYFVTGNHETYLGLDEALPILAKTGIRHLSDEVADIDGLQLVGLDFPSFDQVKDPKKVFESPAYDPKKPTVLLYHTPTSVLQASNGSQGRQQVMSYWSPDLDMSYAKSVGVDLQLSGHTHAGQFPPFSWMAHAFFNGKDHGLFTEDGFSLYVSNGAGTWGPPLRLFNRPEVVAITLRSR